MTLRTEIQFTLAMAKKGHRVEMPAETALALCERWLAVEDAIQAEVDFHPPWEPSPDVLLYFFGCPEDESGCAYNKRMGIKLQQKRVRLVVESEDEWD